MDRAEFLKNVPIFSGLDKKHLKRLANLMVPRTYGPGEDIVEENDQPAGFFVITSGKVEVVRAAERKERQVLAALGPGDFFGEMALFEGYPRNATVRTLENTECLVMPRWDFRAELNSHAEIAVAVLETVVRRLRDTEARLTE